MNVSKIIFYFLVIILIILATSSSFYAYNSFVLDRSGVSPVSEEDKGILGVSSVEEVMAGQTQKLTTISNTIDQDQVVKINLIDSGWEFDDNTKQKSFVLGINDQKSLSVSVGNNFRNGEELNYKISSSSFSGDYVFSQKKNVTVINPILEVEGNVIGVGASGKYRFTLRNKGDINVTITGVGIESTSSKDAVRVSKGSILTADGVQVVNQQIIIGGQARSLSTPQDLNSGESISFEFDRFQVGENEKGKPNVDMRGESVTVKFEFANEGDQMIILSP